MSPIPLQCGNGSARARIVVDAGDVLEFQATYRPSFGATPPDEPGPPATVEDTLASWRSLAELHQRYQGRFASEVRRSAVVLQGLTYQPSGAVVAAATTSLPERMGGDDDLGDLDQPVQDLLVVLADRAAAGWAEPDAGMWEARDRQRQYVSSKVMCWVALDRAIALADRLGPGADPARWAVAREEVRAAVLEQLWSATAGAYAGAFASDDLDASVLLLPLVGFLPADDPRMRATIEAVARELGGGGLVRRWPDDESGFLICTFWLAECLAMAGEVKRAEGWFTSATSYANDLGLMSEEAVPEGGPLLGNFPQAFSHVGLINAAWRITQACDGSNPSDTHEK